MAMNYVVGHAWQRQISSDSTSLNIETEYLPSYSCVVVGKISDWVDLLR